MTPDTWVQVGVMGGIVVLSHLVKVAFDMGQSREREKAAIAVEAARIAREVARDELWDRRHQEHSKKLDAIEVQTTKTNGTVGQHEREIIRLRDAPRCHDCKRPPRARKKA